MSDRELHFRADDLKRLKSMLKRLDEKEAHLQKTYGDRIKGSGRSCDFKDANALRRTIERIESVRTVKG